MMWPAGCLCPIVWEQADDRAPTATEWHSRKCKLAKGTSPGGTGPGPAGGADPEAAAEQQCRSAKASCPAAAAAAVPAAAAPALPRSRRPTKDRHGSKARGSTSTAEDAGSGFAAEYPALQRARMAAAMRSGWVDEALPAQVDGRCVQPEPGPLKTEAETKLASEPAAASSDEDGGDTELGDESTSDEDEEQADQWLFDLQVGDEVEYYSTSMGGWQAARVTSVSGSAAGAKRVTAIPTRTRSGIPNQHTSLLKHPC